MRLKIMRLLPIAAFAAVLAFGTQSALAQSGGAKPATGATADPGKDGQRRTDEITEASRLVTGPAGNPECVWLGRRVVSLLYNDDLDTAFRHLDLYDRFGCPGPHIQQAFRCVIRQGSVEEVKLHACWLNPVTPAQPAAAATLPSTAPGTTRR
jgi:hypothetical protein